MPKGKANDLGIGSCPPAVPRKHNLRFDARACGQSLDKLRLQMRFTRAR